MIHPTAIVDPKAEFGEGASVGPYAVIEGHVTVGARTAIGAHSVLKGRTVIGADCKIGPAAYVGLDPQHLTNDGAGSWLVVGDGTVIRESATIHRSMRPGEENATRVGNRCFIMAGAHAAHDCRIGNDVVMANAVLLGGHVHVGDRAFLGGACGVHQFVRVGRLAIVAGGESLSQDIPPFAAVRYGGLKGYNAVGCRRSGMGRDAIVALRLAYGAIYRNRTLPKIIEAIEALGQQKNEVLELLAFLKTSKRGIVPAVKFHYARLARGTGEDGEE